MSLLYKIVVVKTRLFRKVLGGKVIYKNRLKNAVDCIIAANHVSYLDPLLIGSLFDYEISYLAKAELFKFKPFGKILKSLNTIPIKRGRIDIKALKKAQDILSSGKALLIFPEGSRSSFSAKPGIGKIAVQTKKNILPIYVHNSNKFLSCLFRKKRLQFVIGEKINIDNFIEFGDNKENYRRVAKYILEKINGLKNECENS
ncbi:MAG: lysophospholipid acyltransferase family protein [Candidatus Cloacimonadota bacterium]|nr:lysophospholipid acyltransferase family protein [Candidatus Cloacimonadota bacterium]